MHRVYLVIAFYLVALLSLRQPRGRTAKVIAGVAGLLLGMTITTSMLPFFMACVAGAYLVSLRRWDLTLCTLIGGVAGLVPLQVFNAVSFGSPFLTSYIAGGYPESFLHWNLNNTFQKLRFYFWQITLYVPIVWLGILGLAYYPRALRRELLAMLALFIAMAIQVLNIDSHGGCHYGPRFLLPAMPYACMGLAGFSYLRGQMPQLLAAAAIALAAASSFAVSFAGTLYGAMYCETEVYAFWVYLGPLGKTEWKDMPLAIWLIAPLILSALLLTYATWTCRRFRTAAKPVRP